LGALVEVASRRDGQRGDGRGGGLLVVRRSSRKGKLALAGGFLEEHETWAEGAAREVREEAGIAIDPAKLEPFWFTSTAPRPNRVERLWAHSKRDGRP
jgi:ADP-ribose pyrophosphatase YjhB (NUDIX family)